MLLGLGGATGRGLATCGSASCFLVTGAEEGVGAKGRFIVDMSYRYIDQDRRLAGTRSVSEVLTPKVDFENGVLELDHHREIRTRSTLVEIDMAYGVTDRLTLAWTLPVINERDHEHYDDVGMPTEAFDNRAGTSGFGDIRVGGRYAFMVEAKNLLVGSLFAKLPTGEYKLRDREGAINEPTMQPGSGSIDGLASLLYVHQVIPNRGEWFATISRKANGENDLHYRIGDETQAGAGWRTRTAGGVTGSIQINGNRTQRDAFLGETVPSTGSTTVYLTPGVRWEAKSGTSFYGFVQWPVYEQVNEQNLAPRAGLVLGLSHAY